MSARKDKGTREDSMTLRSSSELADDEGRVFLAYAPPRTLMVMGRRDPRNGDLCVSRYTWKPPEMHWEHVESPDAPFERITGPEAERLLDAVERWIASQQNSRRERAKMTQQSRRQLLMKAVRDAAIELARRGGQYLPAPMPDEPVIMASRIESATDKSEMLAISALAIFDLVRLTIPNVTPDEVQDTIMQSLPYGGQRQ